MKNLVLISLHLLFFSSCAVSLFDGYTRSDQALAEMSSVSFWLENDSTYRLFNATIDMRKNNYSGLMVFNPLPDQGYRVIFMTSFGLKIFDMEFPRNSTYVLHYCMPALNRKYVLSLLRNDLGLLSGHVINVNSDKMLYDRKSGRTVIRTKEKQNRFFYFIDDETSMVNTIIRSSPLIRRTRLDFYGSDGNRLDSLKLYHYHNKLNIKVTQINEITSPVDE